VRGCDEVLFERGVPYGHGKLLDVYRPPAGSGSRPAAVVLLWHGVGPDERDVLEPLARAAAGLGVVVVVPDWRSDAPDEGRAHLLASLTFTREHAPELGGRGDEAIVLAGWSRGGRAAAAIGVRPGGMGGWRPLAVACLGAAYTRPAPTTGTSPMADLAAGRTAPVPFWIVHGSEDAVVPVVASREFAAALHRHGWPVRFEEPRTDHAGVVMSEYDSALRRCRPATADHAVAAGQLSARVLAAAAGVNVAG
jgi:predicted esterase